MRARAGIVLLVLVLAAGCANVGNPITGTPARTAWAFEKTGIDALAARGLDGTGVTVGIVDTGINPDHPDLRGVKLAAWKDLVNGKASPYDDEGHGSHVAGIVAGQKVRGVAPHASLVVVKAISATGEGSDANVASGIDFAVANGAKVICLSLGGGKLPILGTQSENAAKAALAKGVLVVAAAGNDGPNNGDVSAPASVPGVIAVAAVDANLRVADFSSRGSDNDPVIGGLGLPRSDPDKKPEIAAPGVDIMSAWKGTDYASAKGTSQATPFVAGALALLLQAHPGAAPADAQGVETVKRWLESTARPVPGQQTPHDPGAGYGFLDARALVDAAS